MFGNLDIGLSTALRLGLGARVFYSATDNEREGVASIDERSTRAVGLSPTVAVSYAPPWGGIVFFRGANGLRPAGLAPTDRSGSAKFDSDSLTTVELGWRVPLAGAGLSLSGALYHSRWQDVQSDYLTPRGVIATRNVGDARIAGIETELTWFPSADWDLTLRGAHNSALLVRDTDDLDLDDRRLPVTPNWTGALAISRRFALGRGETRVGGELVYTGPARLSFDPGLDRRMGDFLTAAVHAEWRRGGVSATLRGDNLFGSDGTAFVYGNPFSIDLAPQYVVARPRTFTLRVSLQF